MSVVKSPGQFSVQTCKRGFGSQNKSPKPNLPLRIPNPETRLLNPFFNDRILGGNTMSESEMLERIRKALRRTPDSAGRVSAPGVPSGPLARLASLGPLPDVMPAIPPHQLVPRFEEELRKLAGRAWRASSLPETPERSDKPCRRDVLSVQPVPQTH